MNDKRKSRDIEDSIENSLAVIKQKESELRIMQARQKVLEDTLNANANTDADPQITFRDFQNTP